MQTRISEPLPFSLLKAFYSFFLLSLYVDDNCICIFISIELYHSFIFLWPPSRIGTAPSSWSCLPRGISGTYLNPYYFLQTLPRGILTPDGQRWGPLSMKSFTTPVFIPSSQSLQGLTSPSEGLNYTLLPTGSPVSVYCSAQLMINIYLFKK